MLPVPELQEDGWDNLMPEIESGPTTKNPWEYQPGWETEKRLRYGPLFHAGVGGLKTLLDPRYTRPDRVRKNQEELEHQAKVTERAQNKLRYWSDLKSLTRDNNFINILKGIYTDQSHVIGKPPDMPSRAITDLEESTQMNKLYKTLFNKYLTEQTKNPTPIELMNLGIGKNNYRVKTTYHPETGGESMFSNIWDTGISLTPPGAAYQDVLGTGLPIIVAELGSYLLTRGRTSRAINARTKLMTRKVQNLKNTEIKGMREAEKQRGLDRQQIKDGHGQLKGLSTKEDMARDYLNAENRYNRRLAELEKTRRSGEIKAANDISEISDDVLLKNSTDWRDKLDRIPVLGFLAKHPTEALAAVAAGHSAYNSVIGLNQELTHLGLRDDDWKLNDSIPGVLGVLQSYALARGLRNAWGADRHIQRGLIGKQAKSIPAKLSQDPSERAKYLLYKEQVPQPGEQFQKFSKNNDPRLRTRAYVHNPDHGIQAWKEKGSFADRVDGLKNIGADAVEGTVSSVVGGGRNVGWLLPAWSEGKSNLAAAISTKGPGRGSLRGAALLTGLYGASDLLKSAIGGQSVFTNTINPARNSGTSLELGTTPSRKDPRAAGEFNKFGNVEGTHPSDVIYSQRRAGGVLDKLSRLDFNPMSDNRMLYLMGGSRRGQKNPRDARDAYESEIADIKADIKKLSSI